MECVWILQKDQWLINTFEAHLEKYHWFSELLIEIDEVLNELERKWRSNNRKFYIRIGEMYLNLSASI